MNQQVQLRALLRVLRTPVAPGRFKLGCASLGSSEFTSCSIAAPGPSTDIRGRKVSRLMLYGQTATSPV